MPATATEDISSPQNRLSGATADESRDLILPEDAPYLSNLSALWSLDPDLARRIEAIEDASYGVRNSMPNLPFALSDPAGASVALGDAGNPADESRRMIDAVDCVQSSLFYLYGIGFGYHLELLFERCGDEAIFCVFEPDLRLLRTLLEKRDLSKLIESGRVIILTRGEKPELIQRLERHSSLVAIGTTSIDHPASLRMQPEFHARMKQYVAEFAAYCHSGLATLVKNGRRTAENVARNLGWYAAAPSLSRLKDRHRGQPAIIVAAGPSLRKNKHLLKDADGRAVFVAVQTTLQPLLEMGIEPQYVTSLDYHEICTRFFEKLPPTLKTELIAEPKATSLIFDLNPGPLTLLGNDFADRMLRELNLSKDRLRAGATVAHLAFYFAEYIGCDPIIFVGQDLGFSDGLCYTPGTSYEDVWRPELSSFCTVEMKQWEQIVRDRQILRRIPDYRGKPMYTEERLFTYLQQFERDFARSKARIIDATEGGAKKAGAAAMPLMEAIAQYCGQRLPQQIDDHPGLNFNRIGECRGSLRKRIAEAEAIQEIARQTLPLLQEVYDHLDDQVRVNRAIARIDRLHERMDQLSSCYELILQMTQSTELQRFHSDRRIAASKVSGVEKQRRQVSRDIENVRGIAEAAAAFAVMVGDVIQLLSQRASTPAVQLPVPAAMKEAA